MLAATIARHDDLLDVKTGMLLLATEAMTVAALLVVVWLQDRSQRHYANWAAGFAMRALAVALMAMRDTIPDALSITLGNAVSLAGFAFWIAGLRQFDKKTAPWWMILPLSIWLVAVSFPVIADTMPYRAVAYGIATASGYTLLAGVALSCRFGSQRYRRLFAGTWAVLALNILMVAGYAFVERPAYALSLSVAPVAGIIAMVGFFSAILIGAKLVMEDSQQRLELLVRSDPLTGMLNRRGLAEAFADLKRTNSLEPSVIALLQFDLDHFKRINDTHGHQAGDSVLVGFARLAGHMAAGSAVFCRTGGEEFTAILKTGSIREAANLAETIRRALAERPMRGLIVPMPVTVSVGVAAMPADEADLDRLMNHADRALYTAKQDGRNRTALFHDEAAIVVPANDHPAREPFPAVDDHADRQVAVLRRVAELGGGHTGANTL